MNTLALGRQNGSSRELAFGKGDWETVADPHHFSGAPHFRAENNIDACKLAEREDRFLDGDTSRDGFASDPEILKLHPNHHLGSYVGDRNCQSLLRRTALCGWPADLLPIHTPRLFAIFFFLDRELARSSSPTTFSRFAIA
jgi:hypothetical protein